MLTLHDHRGSSIGLRISVNGLPDRVSVRMRDVRLRTARPVRVGGDVVRDLLVVPGVVLPVALLATVRGGLGTAALVTLVTLAVVTCAALVVRGRRLARRAGHARSHDALTPVAVVVVDIDNHRQIVRSWGRATGDRVVTLAGRRLVEHLPPGALVARLGGDVFAAVVRRPGTDLVLQAEGLRRAGAAARPGCPTGPAEPEGSPAPRGRAAAADDGPAARRHRGRPAARRRARGAVPRLPAGGRPPARPRDRRRGAAALEQSGARRRPARRVRAGRRGERDHRGARHLGHRGGVPPARAVGRDRPPAAGVDHGDQRVDPATAVRPPRGAAARRPGDDPPGTRTDRPGDH